MAKDSHDWPMGHQYAQLISEAREKWPDQEKSYTANKILDRLRDQVTNPSRLFVAWWSLSHCNLPLDFVILARVNESALLSPTYTPKISWSLRH